MTTLKDLLLHRVGETPPIGSNKISIIGAGNVGMACAICILNKKISNEICLIDRSENKVQGEILDLKHGASFIDDTTITGGTDMALTKDSRIIIFCAGVAGNPGEKRSDFLQRNAAIIKEIIPKIANLSPKSVILMVTNPVDAMTFLAWKLSGFPKYRVLGSGTNLDSSRFRFFVSERLQVPPSTCETYVIGEHGESCVPVWSAVSVAGVSLRDLDDCIGVDDEDAEGWNCVHAEIVKAGDRVRTLKGYTNWAVALSCAAISEAVLKNTGAIMSVSTDIKGLFGVQDDVFLSIPCALNSAGVESIVKMNLTPHECSLLQKSIKVLTEAQKSLGI